MWCRNVSSISRFIIIGFWVLLSGCANDIPLDNYDVSGKPIRYVKIEGAFQYTSRDRLKQALTPQLRAGYYQADMEAINQALKKLPLVDKVDVKRVWPDAIHIRITEHKPVVRWGDNALLNAQGEVLVPDSIEEFKNLPLITGPNGQEKKLLEIMRGIYIVLTDKSLQLAEFHVNERRAWKIKLASGLEMQLGRKAPLEDMQRFLKTMDLLGEERISWIASVDMRYPNGYAITWKPDAPVFNWKEIAEQIKT